MSRRAAFVYHDRLSRHVLREGHVMVPTRLRYTYELLESYGAFTMPNAVLVEPRQATEEELLTFHTREYVDAVRDLSEGEERRDAAAYGFSDHGDNPVYPGMYEAALWSTGASLTGAEMLANGRVDVAFNCSGGLHHAMPGRASGFCIFNDPVIAINALLKRGMRVAYVDIDAHHGDGVQAAFYDSDRVLTVSLHESGSYLFPGTGFVDEMGEGSGRGFSVNVPLFPYTDDETYLWTLRAVVVPLVQAFQPDVLATQLGMDPYFRDPITHLGLTVQGHARLVEELGRLCPRWLAFGGGGYDLSAVARGWTLDFGVMLETEWPDEIPETYRERYGLIALRDAQGPSVDAAILEQGRRFAESTVEEIERLIFPLHGM
ncbi:MAG: acetoin utilization protein AcuC [Chloroflexota bacterium]|nr:acetoin utilization protein AcuC [Chloroflexota bacterium]MDE3268095.1 acetoin utilization protein AcuC [Chloroflexota bacterium]